MDSPQERLADALAIAIDASVECISEKELRALILVVATDYDVDYLALLLAWRDAWDELGADYTTSRRATRGYGKRTYSAPIVQTEYASSDMSIERDLEPTIVGPAGGRIRWLNVGVPTANGDQPYAVTLNMIGSDDAELATTEYKPRTNPHSGAARGAELGIRYWLAVGGYARPVASPGSMPLCTSNPDTPGRKRRLTPAMPFRIAMVASV